MEGKKNYNIILVNLDGMRRDKVDFCPSLDKLKKQSYFFPLMDTVSPYTFASLHAIFSGMYPSKNGVNGYYNIFKFKKNEIKTITQMLSEVGYFTSCDIIDDSVIPNQGFDDFNIFDEKTVNFTKRHSQIIKDLSKKDKFFLFLHYTETHKNLVRAIVQKYELESNDDNYFRSQKENDKRYNSCLSSSDEYISTLMNTIEESGIADKTILIIFSDHGTSIGEKKGEKFYGVFTYEHTINVFCFLCIPGIQGNVINKQCRTIDILPTIAELAGINLNELKNVQGENLLHLIKNENIQEREVFVETGGLYGPWPSPEKHNVFCLKKNNQKLIYNDVPQTWEFYNLEKDPMEKNNVYDENSPKIDKFKKTLIKYFKDNEIKTKLT